MVFKKLEVLVFCSICVWWNGNFFARTGTVLAHVSVLENGLNLRSHIHNMHRY